MLRCAHRTLGAVVEKGRADWVLSPPPAYEETVSTFDRSWKQLGEKVARLDDAGWARKGQIMMGGKVPSIYGPSGDEGPR